MCDLIKLCVIKTKHYHESCVDICYVKLSLLFITEIVASVFIGILQKNFWSRAFIFSPSPKVVFQTNCAFPLTLTFLRSKEVTTKLFMTFRVTSTQIFKMDNYDNLCIIKVKCQNVQHLCRFSLAVDKGYTMLQTMDILFYFYQSILASLSIFQPARPSFHDF